MAARTPEQSSGIFATYYGKALAAVLVAKGTKATVKVSGESLAAELEVEG